MAGRPYQDVQNSALWEARRLLPDVVLMNVKMPPTETTAHVIKSECPQTGVVILRQQADESHVWALLEKGVPG